MTRNSGVADAIRRLGDKDGATITSAFETTPLSVAQLTAGCASLAHNLSQADAYFTVPVAEGQRLWQPALDSLGQVESTCRTYQASRSPHAAEAVGVAAIKALGPFKSFAHWFEKEAKVPISQ